jgi:hypothetical protein
MLFFHHAWMGGRVVYDSGLENRRTFVAFRGFESHPICQKIKDIGMSVVWQVRQSDDPSWDECVEVKAHTASIAVVNAARVFWDTWECFDRNVNSFKLSVRRKGAETFEYLTFELEVNPVFDVSSWEDDDEV